MSICEVHGALGSVVDGGIIYPGCILEIRRASDGHHKAAKVLRERRITRVGPIIGLLQPHDSG
jgi:hypothetical protein